MFIEGRVKGLNYPWTISQIIMQPQDKISGQHHSLTSSFGQSQITPLHTQPKTIFPKPRLHFIPSLHLCTSHHRTSLSPIRTSNREQERESRSSWVSTMGGSWESHFHFWFCPQASKREERRRTREQLFHWILQDQPAVIQPSTSTSYNLNRAALRHFIRSPAKPQPLLRAWSREEGRKIPDFCS